MRSRGVEDIFETGFAAVCALALGRRSCTDGVGISPA